MTHYSCAKAITIFPDYNSTITLPQFMEWKMPDAGHYVLGLEPSNCRVDGRKKEREAGRLQILRPGQKQEFNLQLRVLDGAKEVAAALR